jgi:hypothetical protein
MSLRLRIEAQTSRHFTWPCVPAADARFETRRRFGNPALLKERRRDLRTFTSRRVTSDRVLTFHGHNHAVLAGGECPLIRWSRGTPHALPHHVHRIEG